MTNLFAFISPGPMELVIIGIIVLLLFGNRLPSTMRNLGKGMLEFKKGLSGTEEESSAESSTTATSEKKDA